MSIDSVRLTDFVNYENSRSDFLNEFALVDIRKKENLIGATDEQSKYFYLYIEVIDFEYDDHEKYIVIRVFDGNYYRLCGDSHSSDWHDWCEVKIDSVKMVYDWGIVS